MSVRIFVEGGSSGPDSRQLAIQSRAAFRNLLEKCNLPGKITAITTCGSRGNAFRDFKNGLRVCKPGDRVVLLVDSEDPMDDINQTWRHLKIQDNWDRPQNATDEQVLMMTTCMETWIVADRNALREHYGANLRERSLPAPQQLESRNRRDIHEALIKATRECKNAYQKGKRSFGILAELNPRELRKHLPSFVRCERLLREMLQ